MINPLVGFHLSEVVNCLAVIASHDISFVFRVLRVAKLPIKYLSTYSLNDVITSVLYGLFVKVKVCLTCNVEN